MTRSKEEMRAAILTPQMTKGQALIWRFCKAIKAGKPPSQEDLNALAGNLEEVLAVMADRSNPQKPAAIVKALGLEAGRGRKTLTLREMEMRLRPATEVLALMRKGTEREAAIQVVAKKHKMSDAQMDANYRRNRKYAVVFEKFLGVTGS